MLLIDDEENTVIGPISQKVNELEKIYDFDLMMDGGHVKGYLVQDENTIESITLALKNLIVPEVFRERYGVGADINPLLFAVGDGNHSLATAKAHWENVKKDLPKKKFFLPSKVCSAEANVHDEGLTFELAHRCYLMLILN